MGTKEQMVKIHQNAMKNQKKALIDKACEYAQSKYDLDYCGDVRDVLNYLKSLVEE